MRDDISDGTGNRVVIKVGTSSLITRGKVDPVKLDALCATVSKGIEAGLAPVLVTSGAIALGRTKHSALAQDTAEAAQTAAALGQGVLYAALQARFAAYGLETGQILLTPHDLVAPERGGGVRRTLDLMRTLGAVPVVNENDALGVRNNDVLAALLSGYVGARLLLLLTNVAGLYDGNPLLGRDAVRITEVTGPISEVEAVAGGSTGDGGTGGMLVKLSACWIATHAGVRTVVADATDPAALAAAFRGDEVAGTVFPPRTSRSVAPGLGRLWRAFRNPPSGSVVCDAAGQRAIESGRALLGGNIEAVKGSFGSGDVVDVAGPDSRVIARGSVLIGSAEAGSAARSASAFLNDCDYVRISGGQLCR
ncbi:glutamate 5-kinase [Streptomyces beigongshangae]|uniref:glutamate 5-kinase n=1 Tax=Streptomyces beigongshangae TaxID=2841597 RepID=UPI001C8469A2|nr:glutamate 5-kinase [Streptomyces sp. REN17]